MRCPGRSGWGKASTASDRGGGSLASAKAFAGLWPVKSRLAVPRSTATRAPSHEPRCVRRRKLRAWATTGVVSGVWTISQLCSWVVSVAEIDKRRAAFAPQVKNLRTRRGSSFSVRKHRKAKERRKPAQRWLSCEYGGGLSVKESTCRWKTLRAAKPLLLTRGWGKQS